MSGTIFTPPLQLNAMEYIGEMSSGVTRAKLIWAFDKHQQPKQIVLKLNNPNARMQGAHYKDTSLACELICAVIARALDLNVQDYAVIKVTKDFAESVRNKNPLVSGLLLQNIGEHFGSVHNKSLREWSPRKYIDSQEIINQFEDILTFDAVIMNPDRREGNPNLMYDRNLIVPIDHSLALIKYLSNPMSFNSTILTPPEPLLSQNTIEQHCAYLQLKQKGCLYKRLLAKWQERINRHKLNELRKMLPRSWNNNQDHIDMIFSFLENRHHYFEDVSTRLIEVLS